MTRQFLATAAAVLCLGAGANAQTILTAETAAPNTTPGISIISLSEASAKAGVAGLTRALAMEFADRGVTVNCVAPGKIGGKRSATAGESPEMPGGDRIPVGRKGTVDEAAAMICTLCLPESRFVTGQTIHVSGGLYMA